MRWRKGSGNGRHRRDVIDDDVAPEPSGIRILHPDGSESACTVTRSAEDTPDGLALWFVHPPDGVLFNPAQADRLMIGTLPGRTALGFMNAALAMPPPPGLPVNL